MNKKKKLQAIYLMIPFAIAVITCLFVNYAVDQQFTWSLLVTGSCVYAYLALFALLLGGKQRLLWTYAVICVFIVPYLYLIEWTANLYLPDPIFWVLKLGVPLSVIWLVACGLIALIRRITRANFWLIAGLSIVAFYISERLTNSMVDGFVGSNESWQLSEHFPLIYLGPAAILIFVGLTLAMIRHTKKAAR